MSVSIPVSPIDITSLAGVSPLVLQPSATAAAVVSASPVTGNSTVVELSPQGLRASAISTLGNDLTRLLSTATDTSPSTVLDTATSLVEAFNTFQNRLRSLQTTTLPDVVLTNTSLTNLGTIGIAVQDTAIPVINTNLNIDPTILTAAAISQTASTQELLTGVIQSLLDQVRTFEEAIIGRANTLIQTTAFSTPPTTNAATGTVAAAAPATPAPTGPAATTTATATTLAAATTNDALAADIRAFANRLALQNLINDPATRAVSLVVDPNYAAIIAASHLADFVSMPPVDDPNALVDDVAGAVLPVAPTRGISYPNENAGGSTEDYRNLAQTKA